MKVVNPQKPSKPNEGSKQAPAPEKDGGVNWLKLGISLAIPAAVGLVTGLLIGESSGSVYSSLTLPPLAPPQWLFPVVWSVMYLLMGVAFYLVWVSDCSSAAKKNAFIAYGIQLAINAAWSPVFFLLRLYSVAAAVIVVLLIAVTATLERFSRCSLWAGRLMLPYMIWVAFASYLNISIALLN